MRQLREERNREIADAVECSKQVHIAALAAQSQVDENNNESVKIDKPDQSKLQKELSTISERTEQSSLLNNGVGNANKAASSNTLTAASPANTNLSSNIKNLHSTLKKIYF